MCDYDQAYKATCSENKLKKKDSTEMMIQHYISNNNNYNSSEHERLF